MNNFLRCLAAWSLLFGSVASASDLAKGEAVFKAQCASCHGLDGQGTRDKYSEPLAGDLSITELAKVIDETMPEGSPRKVRQKIRRLWPHIFTRLSILKWLVNDCDQLASN